MYKLTFYVPKAHLEAVKNHLFEHGAGKIGNYDCCCWQTKGIGQFRPLEGSKPFSGEIDKTQREEEWLIEIVCEDSLLKTIISELKKAHPYEEPAFQYWKVNED